MVLLWDTLDKHTLHVCPLKYTNPIHSFCRQGWMVFKDDTKHLPRTMVQVHLLFQYKGACFRNTKYLIYHHKSTCMTWKYLAFPAWHCKYTLLQSPSQLPVSLENIVSTSTNSWRRNTVAVILIHQYTHTDGHLYNLEAHKTVKMGGESSYVKEWKTLEKSGEQERLWVYLLNHIFYDNICKTPKH